MPGRHVPDFGRAITATRKELTPIGREFNPCRLGDRAPVKSENLQVSGASFLKHRECADGCSASSTPAFQYFDHDAGCPGNISLFETRSSRLCK